jgi:hypothetical protein
MAGYVEILEKDLMDWLLVDSARGIGITHLERPGWHQDHALVFSLTLY